MSNNAYNREDGISGVDSEQRSTGDAAATGKDDDLRKSDGDTTPIHSESQMSTTRGDQSYHCNKNYQNPLHKSNSTTESQSLNRNRQGSSMSKALAPLFHEKPKPPNITISIETTVEKYKRCKTAKAFICPVLSLMSYLGDIGTDVYLAFMYLTTNYMLEFWITLSCIIIPTMITTVVDCAWIINKRKKETNPAKVRRSKWWCILAGFGLGRIIRGIKQMIHIYKYTQAEEQTLREMEKWKALSYQKDCNDLDCISAFVEGAPQLCLQLYLLYSGSLDVTLLKGLSISTSVIAIACSYSTLYRTNRKALGPDREVDFFPFIIYILASLCALIARLLTIVLFAVYIHYMICIDILLFHCICMFIWIKYYQKPKLRGYCNSDFSRTLYITLFAYIHVLCFINLKERGKVQRRMLLYYAVLYLENFAMAAILLWNCPLFSPGNILFLHLTVLPVGMILHVVLTTVYYRLLHPTTGAACCKRGQQGN